MQTAVPSARSQTGSSLIVAAVASIGAGAIHAVAAGSHADTREAMWAFVALSVVQIAWGAVALRWPGRAVAAVGVALGLGAVIGWIVAMTSGISFVEGLDTVHSPATGDIIAVGLAGVATVGSALRAASLPTLPRLAPAATLVVAAIALPGMVAATSDDHGDHGGGEAHGDEHAEGDDHAEGEHGDDEAAHAEGAAHDEGDEHATGEEHGAGHEGPAIAPKPYDPNKPIDLGGVEGVTLQQQARAENLIATTLYQLPQFSDPEAAEALGWHSIGDGATGYEHLVNRQLIDDDKILDPDYPEALVYQTFDGERKLVAAMYMLRSDQTLDDVPDVGGPLTQWHIHNNLCFTPDPVAPKVGGLTNADGSCTPPLVKGTEAPMLHVWIVPHKCGPFAALDGVGGGQIKEGEERLCDEAHGAH